MHVHRFKEMLCIAEALLAGDMSKPLYTLGLQWYYMLLHKNDQTEFATAGKKLRTEMLESVTKFFEAQFTQNNLDGTHECMDLCWREERPYWK
jgi:hypothetical protein